MTKGERVREVRKSANLTLDKFGERLGIKKSAVSQIENDKSNLTSATALLICKEFNVNETWLLTGEGSMRSETTKEQKIAQIVSRLSTVDEPVKLSLISLLSRADEGQLRAVLLEMYKELEKNGVSFDE